MRAPNNRRFPTSFSAHSSRSLLMRCAALVLSMALLGGCFSSESSIGVVDGASIVQDGTPGRNAVAHLAKVREILQGNLNAVVKKLESYPDKQQAQQILQGAQLSLQQTLDAHESQVNAQLSELFQQSVRECRTAKKLDAVMSKDNLLDFAPELSVTGDVLALFDKKELQLPLMPAVVADPALPAPLRPAAAKAAPARATVEERARAEPAPKAEPRRRQPAKKDDKRR